MDIPVAVLVSALCSFEQRPGALLRTLAALAWRIDHETPGSGRTTVRGLSPRTGSTPPQLAAKRRSYCIRRRVGTRLGAGNSSRGQAGCSRNTRSKREDPMRFRIIIDVTNLNYTDVSSHFQLLIGSGGRLARRAIPRPRPPRILCVNKPFRLSSATQHQLAAGHSVDWVPLRLGSRPVKSALSPRLDRRLVPKSEQIPRAMTLSWWN